jgi:hypothetical protein
MATRSRPLPDHEHDHGHVHAEPVLGPSTDGSVVLELGVGLGALVLYTEAELDGDEIDLFRRGEDRPFVHSAVRARDLVGGTVHAAVYPDVPAGEYVIAAHGAVGPLPVSVPGGLVTEVPVGGRA